MAFQPTNEQREAIITTENALVSAAAGSGKTAVIVERIARLFTLEENPIRADRVLIVTFTNPAAAELRSRIEKKLNECLAEKPNDRNLQEQIILLNNAHISTIDSFCINLIRDNFEKAGIDPTFKIANNTEQRMIEKSVLSKIMNEEFEKDSENFNNLIDFLSDSIDDYTVSEYVSKIHSFSSLMPYPDMWIKNIVAKYEAFINGEDNEWFDEAISIVREVAEECYRLMDSAIAMLELNPDVYPKYIKDFKTFLKSSEEICTCCDNADWDGIYNLLNSFNSPGLQNPGKKSDINSKTAKSYRDKVQKLLTEGTSAGSCLKKFVFANAQTLRTELQEALPHIKKIGELAIKYSEELEKEFSLRGLMTFPMVEQCALKLLTEYKDGKIVLSEDADDYISDFDVVMVDEYQDTNNLQDTLFNAISNNQKNLFCVGDAKQSIYRFRGANPHNFIQKKKEYKIKSEEDRLGQRIDLAGNFRSRHEICRYVNKVMSIIMRENMSDIEYDDREELKPLNDKFLVNDEAEIENHYINLSAVAKKAPSADVNNDNFKSIAEANVIAKRIKELVNGKEILMDKDNKGKLRVPKYSDITILMRAPSNVAKIYAEVLRKHNIPVTIPDAGAFNSEEVNTMISLLRVIDNPFDDVSLLTVMASRLYCFTINEIAEIRSYSTYDKLISDVAVAAQTNAKAKNFLDDISLFRDKNAILKVSDLIDYIFDATNFQGVVSRLEDGEVKKNNLETLYSVCASFEKDGRRNLKEFLNYIDHIKDKDTKADIPFSGEAVKICSIHASKGLQYPICILADNNHQFDFGDSKSSLLLDESYGISFKFFDKENFEKRDTLSRILMQRYTKQQILAEQTRLLYVALTRAEEKLIVTNTYEDLNKEILNIQNSNCIDKDRMNPVHFLSSQSFSEWLLAADFHYNSAKFNDYAENGKISFGFHNEYTPPVPASKPPCKPDEDIVSALKDNYSKKYEFEELLTVESKASVTSIIHKSDESKYQFTSKPDFMNEDGISAAGKGTATHKFMEHCDYEKAEISVSDECERLYESGFMTFEESKAVNVESVEKFFNSDLYKRIKASQEVKREMNFLSEFPATYVHHDLPEKFKDEKIIVQGAVDLVFVEDDEIVIVDFKTDRNKSEEELVEAYAEQLRIYSIACENLLKKKTKQLILYPFSLGKEVYI